MHPHFTLSMFMGYKLFISILVIICLYACTERRQMTEHSKGGTIEWKDTTHLFEKIDLNNPIDSFDFKFTNIGNKLLVILHARSSCNCTSVKYPRTPIMPGDSSHVRVIYNGNNRLPEYFNKIIEVYTNATDKPAILRISGQLK